MQTDASRSVARIIEEATLGTTPATPAFQTLRPTAINMSFGPKTKESAELLADRQVADLIRVGIETGGDIPMEASYKTLDIPIRGVMMSDWIRFPVRDNSATTAQISAVSATLYTVVTATVSPAAPGTILETNSGTYGVQHLVYASGFGVAGNNGLKVVTAATATQVTAAGLAIEASPPATARLKVVGIQGVATDISISGSTLVSATLNFATLGIVAGMWVKVGGTAALTFFGTAVNNDWVRVLSVAVGVLTLDVMPAGWANDAGTSKTIQLFVGDAIRNGVTPRSYSVEVEYSDLIAPEWDTYTGQRIGTWELMGDAQDILETKFTLMGLNATNSTTRFTGATTVGAPSNAVMNTSTSVGELRINNALVNLGPNFVKSFSMTHDNTLRRQAAIGSLADIGIGLGRAQIKGKMSTYYGSNAVRTALLNGTAMSWNGVFYDPTVVVLNAFAPAYHVDIPYLKWVDGDPTIAGVDTDRILDLNYQGLKSPVYGYTIQVMRFDYIAT